MIRTLAWKELREHWIIWLAMLALTGLLVTTIYLFDPTSGASGRNRVPPWAFAALLMAGIYGLVCGAMLLAGEREGSTLAFLDLLTGKRLPLWAIKTTVGMGLSLGQALVTGLGLSLLDTHLGYPTATLWWLLLPAVVLEAFAWGLLFSAWFRSVLVAALPGAFFVTLGWLISVSGDFNQPRSPWFLHVCLIVAALAGSALLFCWPDLRRRPALPRLSLARLGLGKHGLLRVLLWQQLRQGRWWLAGLVVGSALLGSQLPFSGLPIWIVGTLAIGVVCGHRVFAGEQSEQAYRFLGQQRLPMGRIWIVKTLFWAAAALLATLLLYLAGLRQAADERRLVHVSFGDNFFPFFPASDLYTIGRFGFLILWLWYGFAIAALLGQVIRKPAVALVIALIMTAFVTFWWVPSLVGGGLSLWLLLPPPLVLLLCTRLTVWDWVNETWRQWRPLLVLAGGGLFVVLWTALVLWYRAIEVPEPAEPFNFGLYAMGLAPAENGSGRLIREAMRDFLDIEKNVKANLPMPEPLVSRDAQSPIFFIHLDRLRVQDPPVDTTKLETWLHALFQGQWLETLRQGLARWPGMIVSPHLVRFAGDFPEATAAGMIHQVLVARAFLELRHGNLDKAQDLAFLGLTLSRHLRTNAPLALYSTGAMLEDDVFTFLKHWLGQTTTPPAIARRIIEELQRHETQLPDPANVLKFEYLAVHENLEVLLSTPRWPGQRPPEIETDLILWARHFPWEAERERRQIQDVIRRDLEFLASAVRQRGDHASVSLEWLESVKSLCTAANRLAWRTSVNMFRVRFGRIHSLLMTRVLQLQAALLTYQQEKGKAAQSLDDLLPDYLPRLPLDPYSNQPFGYRISGGETIVEDSGFAGMTQEFAEVEPGQGVLWSVGPDRINHGGLRASNRRDTREADLIYLVPHVKVKR